MFVYIMFMWMMLQVSITTYLNVTGESQEGILRCAYVINNTLTSPNLLDSRNFRELVHIPKISNDDCMQVTIHPRYFTFMFAAWVCAEPLIVNATAFACIAGEIIILPCTCTVNFIYQKVVCEV